MKRIYKIKQKSQYGGDEPPKKVCDKNTFPELPSILNTDRNLIDRIICIGDIHGSLSLAIRYLEIPQLIQRVYEENDMTVSIWYKDEKIKRIYEWIGRKTIAVQVGDQVDRCRPYKKNCQHPDATIDDEASDITIMFFYSDLHQVAKKVDCALFSLLGNHELINVMGNMQYVSYKGLKEFPTSSDNIIEGRVKAFAKNSNDKIYKEQATLVEFLGCSRLASIIVDGYLFVHAGIMESLVKHIKKNNNSIVPTINDAVKSWLLSAYRDDEKSFVESLIQGNELSPFWPRIFGSIKSNLDIQTSECKKIVQPVLEALNIKGIVVGHTPQIKININSTCSNTVWRVDVASSQAFDEIIFSGVKPSDRQNIQKGRVPQVLEIVLSKSPESSVTNNLDTFNVLIDH